MDWSQTFAIIVSTVGSIAVAGWTVRLKLGNLVGQLEGLTRRMDDFHDRFISLESAQTDLRRSLIELRK